MSFDSQFGSPCADFILNLNECFEAYGVWRGKEFCKEYQEDANECKNNDIRLRSIKEIYRVRTKKILTGELSAKEAYQERAPPNSFLTYPNHR